MSNRSGVIFLDGSLVIIRIYELSDNEFRLVADSVFDLFGHGVGQLLEEAKAIEIIGQAMGVGFGFSRWRIYARNLPAKMTRNISVATGQMVKELTPYLEKEFLCLGMVMGQ